jgi:hypothetical protein
MRANFLGSQMTIAQIVYDNERSFGYDDKDIHSKVRLTWHDQMGLNNMGAVNTYMGDHG